MKIVNKSFLCILLILLFVPAISLFAQTKQTTKIPNTPVGNQLTNWLRVFESGNQENIKLFIAENYNETLLKESSAHNRADRQARTFIDSRGFDVRRIEKSSENEIVVSAQARLTNLWYRLTLKVEPESPYRVAEFSSQRILPPHELKQTLSGREFVKEIENFMNKLSAVDAFSGTLLVAKDGKIIFKKAYGLASKAYNIPNRIDTNLNIASVTKMFTAVSIMQLVEQNRLSLNDTVAKILPDYPNRKIAEKITVHHLLSHSSGLGDFHGKEYICRKGVLRKINDYFPLFVNEPLSFEPGEKMQYSNVGYILLGAIIEKISGENYFEFVRNHIFIPSGMKNTDFYETDLDTPNLATGYTNFEDKGDDYFEFHLGQKRNVSLYGGAKGNSQGGAFSTAEDLFRFSLAVRSGKLINAKSFELMTAPKYFFRKYAASDVYYGYGFELENVNNKRVVGHGGGDLGISSAIRWYPDSGNYTFAVLSNYDRGGIVVNDKLQDLILWQLFEQ